MILWVFIVLIVLAILFLSWWFTAGTSIADSNLTFQNYPTIHARCQSHDMCGGDLTCDANCHRCRKKLGGDCANSNDCESGLHCQDWKCTNIPNLKNANNISDIKEPKVVKWNEEKNETYYI